MLAGTPLIQIKVAPAEQRDHDDFIVAWQMRANLQ
jgi:hypothetical protein